MDYKIAIASSDGVNIDRHLGGAESFRIYGVKGGEWHFLEERRSPEESTEQSVPSSGCGPGGCAGKGDGCNAGPAHIGGCGSGGSLKVDSVSDCRCVVCLKTGFQVQKQLERRAISSFDVSCTVAEALEKITEYYKRVDRHESLRNQRQIRA